MKVPALLPQVRQLPEAGVLVPDQLRLADGGLHVGNLALERLVLRLEGVKFSEIVHPALDGPGDGGGGGAEGGGDDPRQIRQHRGGGGDVGHHAHQHRHRRRYGQQQNGKLVDRTLHASTSPEKSSTSKSASMRPNRHRGRPMTLK